MYAFEFGIIDEVTASLLSWKKMMPDVKRQADALKGSLQGAAKVDGVAPSVMKTKMEVKALGNELRNAGNMGNNAFSGAKRELLSLGATVVSTQALLGSLNKTADLQGFKNAINFSAGSDGAAQLAFLEKTITDLKLPLEASYEGFKTLSGGLMGTGLSGQQTQDIFKSVADASVVMGLKADETKGSFLALAQMASKGTISAEELRGQLGERLPGAFSIAARAMGVTQKQLGKMLEGGELSAKQFLPAFAAELHKTFGAAVPNALNGARANFNEFNNTLYQLQTTFGERIMPTVTHFLQGYVIPAVRWVSLHIDGILGLATALGAGYLAYQSVMGAIALYRIATTVATAVNALFTGGFAALNAVMYANPIGLVIGAFAALTAGAVYAWQKFEGFRGFLFGMWEVIKTFGQYIFDFAVRPLDALGRILIGVFTADTALIKDGLEKSVETMKANVDNMMNVGVKFGNSFTEGWNKGIADFRTQNPLANANPNLNLATIKTTNSKVDLGIGDKAKGRNVEGNRQIKNVNITIGSLISGGFTVNVEQLSDESPNKIKEILQRLLVDATNQVNYQ